MSVLYRAVWQCALTDEPEMVTEDFRTAFTRWALNSPTHDPLPDGTSTRAGRTLVLESREGETRVLAAESIDEDDAGGALWKTVAKVVVADGHVHYLVENHLDSDDVTQHVAVGRPRLVRDLLSRGGKHWLGDSALLTTVLEVTAPGVPVLVELLRSPGRTLPYIVFSEPPTTVAYEWRRLAEKVAQRATGIATVVVLDHSAVAAFRKSLGELAVWGGGVRTYVPTPIDASGHHQHRYIPARHIAHANETRIADRLVLAVAQMSSRRRVPDLFDRPQEDAEEGLDLTNEVESLKQQVEDLEFELAVAREDHDETERELSRSRGHFGRLEAALKNESLLGVFYGTAHAETEDSLPDEVQAVSEAFLAARLYLADDLSIPEDAGRDHDPLDTADCAVAWGNTTWRGLRALAAYARDKRQGFVGNFWIWCQAGRPEGWPASEKKLTMVEADAVRNRPKFRDARFFPVETSLDPSGRKYMESHLKIAQGGGDLAPRVYFYDDTGGTTGKVHIGLVGPRYLVPNTKS